MSEIIRKSTCILDNDWQNLGCYSRRITSATDIKS